MTRVRWWSVLVVLSVGVVLLDIATGTYIMFPVVFVIPVGLAGWYLGRNAGIGFAVTLVGCRVGILVVLEQELTPAWAEALNAGIRVAVLVGLAVLIAKVAQQKRMLAERVQVLEGLLPICSFCKKIRRPDGVWEQIEIYVSHRSAAEFSHGFCEACEREHYGKYLRFPDDKASKSG
ncbi:MAG: hypothetical protein MRK02_06595 [Candidatus Scalindua sp.]|nr:hypothetical protein [Candidatus Scalindua sp.]